MEVFELADDPSAIDPSEAYKAMIADLAAKEEKDLKSSDNKRGHTGKKQQEASKLKFFVADNGTRYCWDEEEDCWVEDNEFHQTENHDHEDNESNYSDEDSDAEGAAKNSKAEEEAVATQKRKRNKKKKPNKISSNWVYVSGLPTDVTIDEVKSHFSKVGLIAINPLDQSPKIKLYKDENGSLKGDCSICYNSDVSVQMAVDILNEGYIRPSYLITVTKATFDAQHAASSAAGPKRPKMTHAQVKVAMSAMRQALSWAEDDDTGISRSQALKIVVIQHMFAPSDFEDPTFEDELEKDISSECYKCGEIEKITLFSKHPLGVVIVKFATSFGAQECIKLMNGRFYAGRQLKCFFWDGTTDYSAANTAKELEKKEKEEQARLDEFGDWIEQEELPEEFELRVEK